VRLINSFSPIRPGEIINLAFNFSDQTVGIPLLGTFWTCALQPGGPGVNISPQTFILCTSVSWVIRLLDPWENKVVPRFGAFSIASVGGIPISVVGGVLLFEATVFVADGRIFKKSTTALCSQA